MKPLRCDFCNGNLVIDESREFATCEFCGTKYMKSTIQQKIQEIRGTVSIDGPVETREVEFVIRGGTLISYNGEKTEVKIPDTVVVIGKNAFQNLAVQSVTIPDSVKKIDTGAFSGTLIRSIIIPDSVVEISTRAFYGCKFLERVVLPQKPFTVEKEAPQYRYCAIFAECRKLKTIENIGNYPKSYLVQFSTTLWEQERIARQFAWRNQKRCSFCGGQLTGSFFAGWSAKKCSICHRVVDYDYYGNFIEHPQDYLII